MAGVDAWSFGVEIWCNLEGRYTHIVGDLSHQSGTIFTQTLCQLGIMGTRYIRDIEPPVYHEHILGMDDRNSIFVQHIYSELEIGNELDIYLRQASELSFIDMVRNGRDGTNIYIDSRAETGEHTLIIESFDRASSA